MGVNWCLPFTPQVTGFVSFVSDNYKNEEFSCSSILKEEEMKTKTLAANVGIAALTLASVVHAAPITMTATQNYTANRTWQDIRSTVYDWADANGNNRVDVGEKVTFTVDMHKTAWGVHDYDALKVWIDTSPINPPASTLLTRNFVWDFDVDDSNMTTDRWWNPSTRRWEDVSFRPWTGGDRFFSFEYTFAAAGTFNLTASVMCSADLSGLSGYANGTPTTADWNAWTQNIHGPGGSRVYQGETERYQLQVYEAVPEPGTLALFGLGIMGFAGYGLSRRRKKA
jgi:PEP-CTERM motif